MDDSFFSNSDILNRACGLSSGQSSDPVMARWYYYYPCDFNGSV